MVFLIWGFCGVSVFLGNLGSRFLVVMFLVPKATIVVLGKGEVVAPSVETVVMVVVEEGVVKVKTMARGKQRRRAQRSEIGVGDSMMSSGQPPNWWRGAVKSRIDVTSMGGTGGGSY